MSQYFLKKQKQNFYKNTGYKIPRDQQENGELKPFIAFWLVWLFLSKTFNSLYDYKRKAKSSFQENLD